MRVACTHAIVLRPSRAGAAAPAVPYARPPDDDPGLHPIPAPPPPAAVLILLGGGIIRGYRDMAPLVCSPSRFAAIGSSLPGCSCDVTPEPPAAAGGRRRAASFVELLLPLAAPGDPDLSSSPGGNRELIPAQPAVLSPVVSARDDGDVGVVAGLLGRDPRSPGGINRPPPPAEAAAAVARAILWGLRGAPAPATERIVVPSFRGPGGPSAGRGRSQERQRNLEFRREARTAEFAVESPFPLLFPTRASLLPPLVMRAASLLTWRRYGRRGGGGEGVS